MLDILDHFKFQSIKQQNRLNRHPIFCYDFIIGLAMLMLMLHVLTLLTVHKPLMLFRLKGYSFLLLFPVGLVLSNIIVSVYGLVVARNMLWWLISLISVYGFLTKIIINYAPAPSFFQYENAFSYVFHDIILIALLYAIALFIIHSLNNSLLAYLKARIINKYQGLCMLLALCTMNFIAFIFLYRLFTFSQIINIDVQWLPLLIIQLCISLVLCLPQLIIIAILKKKEAIQKIHPIEHYHWFEFSIVKKERLRQLRVVNNKFSIPAFRYNYLLGLVMAYMLFMLISGVTAFRLAHLHFLIVGAGICLVPIIYSISNITTEIYGYLVARNMLWWFIITSLVFTLLSMLLAGIPSIPNFQHNKDYQLILGSMPLIFIAGILGTIGGIIFNNIIVSKLKRKFSGYHYWLRAILTTAGGEIIYNFIAYPIMYFNKLNLLHHFFFILFSVFLFKLATTAIIWPIECYIAGKLKLSEKVNVFDYDVNYHIFRFSTKQNKLIIISLGYSSLLALLSLNITYLLWQ